MKTTRKMRIGKHLFFISLIASVFYNGENQFIINTIAFVMGGSVVIYLAPIFKYMEERIWEKKFIENNYKEFLKSKDIKDTDEKTEGDA